MLGLVLEGGGARGAYQAGAIRAFLSHGYYFKCVTGTSIGALNGVMYAQHRFDESYSLWQNMEFSTLFDFEDKYAENLAKMKLDKDTLKYFFVKLKEAIANKGLDTSRIKSLLGKFIDEDKLRASDIDFGLLTVSINEMKPYEVFVNDIPYGKVADYVMASANFPGFSKMTIGDKTFVDGGLYDNMPINMMVNHGYTDVVAIETKSFIPKRKCKDNNAQVVYIKPSEKPGRMLDFNNEPVARAMRIGRFDAMRHIKGYVGSLYYLQTTTESPFGYGLLEMNDQAFIEIAQIFNVKEEFRKNIKNLKKILLELLNKYSKSEDLNIAEALLRVVERVASKLNVERLKVYTIKNFIKISSEELFNSEKSSKKNKDNEILYIINKFYWSDL